LGDLLTTPLLILNAPSLDPLVIVLIVVLRSFERFAGYRPQAYIQDFVIYPEYPFCPPLARELTES
jgi:hypothetical protein